jgi:hypothetical protein
MCGESWIGKDLGGSGCGLIEVLSTHLPARTEGNYKKTDSGYLEDVWLSGGYHTALNLGTR